MANKTHIYDGAAWRPIKKVYVYDSGSTAWRLVKYSWVYDGANWRQVHTNAYIFNKTFSSPASDYDLMNDIMSMPAPTAWNGTDDIEASITINPGIEVYSTVAGSPGYALRIAPAPSTNPSKSFPPASVINLTLAGSIVGKGGTGGAGGDASSTYYIAPIPPGKPAVSFNQSASNGAQGGRGGNALVLGYPVNVTVPPTGSIKSGGGGGGGGGGSVAQLPGIPGNIGGYVAGAVRGGSGGGGGAGSAYSPAPAGSGGAATATAAPPDPSFVNEKGDGAVGSPAPSSSYGAGGAPFSTTAISDYPFGVTAVGGAGGAGGAVGNAGTNGTSGTAPSIASPNPGSPSPTFPFNNVPRTNASFGAGGASGTAIKGTSYFVSPFPLSSPQIIGPNTPT